MSEFTNILKEPYPYEDSKPMLIRSYLTVSIFIVLFLLIFKPFGLSNIQSDSFTFSLIISGYGLITFVISLTYDWLAKIAFSKYFDDQNWNVGKQIFSILVMVFIIGLGNFFYSHFMGFIGLSGTTMLMFQLYTLLVAFFPVTIFTLIGRVRFLNANLKQAEAINKELSKPITEIKDNIPNIKFVSENEKDVIELTPDQFIYAESADNYSDVVYLESKIVRRVLIRSSLKRLVSQNPNLYIFSPHRTYIVNLRKITKINGTSQGYLLRLDGVEETIPVSRRNVIRLKNMLSHLRASQ